MVELQNISGGAGDAGAAADAGKMAASLGAIQNMQDDFKKIKTMAANGDFAVGPDSGKAIQKAIDQYQQDWVANKEDLLYIKNFGLPLGQEGPRGHYDHYAKTVSDYHKGKADDAYNKFVAFYDSLTEFREAITQAMKNYSTTEQDNAQAFKMSDYL